jgi:hypothetical protein
MIPRPLVSLLLISLSLVSALLAPARALAQPAAVEDLIREGVELRKNGKDHLALPLFQKAYDLERSGRSAGQLGLAEASLGYWMSAERHLVESLSASRNPWVARNEAELRRTLQGVQASIGEVEVTGTPSGAEVTVNGQVAGRLPLARPVRVPEGAVQVSLSAPGHRTGSTSALVEGGKRSKLVVALERQDVSGPPAVRPDPVPEPSAETAETDEAPARRARSSDGGAAWVRPASWFTAAGAVAALAVGAYGLTAQHSRVDKFDSYMPDGGTNRPCNLQSVDKGGGQCPALLKRVESAERLAVGGFVVGGVLAAAAVVGFIYSAGSDGGRESQESRESDVALSLDPGNPATGAPFQVGLSVRF